MQRHLAAFEALDGNAGTRLLPLDAASGGLALAGPNAAAEAAARLAGPRAVGEFGQFHRAVLISWLVTSTAPAGRIARRRTPGHPKHALSLLLNHANEVMNLGDHAAGHRGIGELLDAPDLVQTEPDQDLALDEMAARRARRLLDRDGF